MHIVSVSYHEECLTKEKLTSGTALIEMLVEILHRVGTIKWNSCFLNPHFSDKDVHCGVEL